MVWAWLLRILLAILALLVFVGATTSTETGVLAPAVTPDSDSEDSSALQPKTDDLLALTSPEELPSNDIGQENDNSTSISFDADELTRLHTFGARFFAYVNPENPDEKTELKIGDKDSLSKSGLIAGKSLKIYAHGFLAEVLKDSFGHALKNAYLQNGFKNFILVQWETSIPGFEYVPIANYGTYLISIWKYLPKSCEIITKLLMFLVDNNFKTESMHLIGTSLGAHLVGCAGHRMQSEHGLMINRVTGLDPAGPFRETIPAANKISKSSGKFVDAYHSGIDGFGMPNPVGHVDFYLNGGVGVKQNGCSKKMLPSALRGPAAILCAHVRASAVWSYTVQKSVVLYGYPCGEKSSDTSKSSACKRPPDFDAEEKVRAGEYASNAVRGKFYLPITKDTIAGMKATNVSLPFAKF